MELGHAGAWEGLAEAGTAAPHLAALLTCTTTPVRIASGVADNVVSDLAELTLDVRLSRGVDIEEVVNHIARCVDNRRIEIHVSVPPLPEVGASSLDTDLFKGLKASIERIFPYAPVASGPFFAETDAYAWRSRGIPIYGLYPYPVSADDISRMHGVDERVRIDSLDLGLRLILDTLSSVAGQGV